MQPLTWPEYTDRAKRLTKEQEGKFVQFGYDGANEHDVLFSYQQATGKPAFNEDFSRWNMDQADAVTQLQYLANLKREFGGKI